LLPDLDPRPDDLAPLLICTGRDTSRLVHGWWHLAAMRSTWWRILALGVASNFAGERPFKAL